MIKDNLNIQALLTIGALQVLQSGYESTKKGTKAQIKTFLWLPMVGVLKFSINSLGTLLHKRVQ